MKLRRAIAAVMAAAGLVLFTGGTIATSESQVVVQGAESGSHLRLTMSGDNLVVNGYMAPVTQLGCRYTHFHNAAVCPLAGVASVEVNMGPSSDKVEVQSPLPIPLITHLGAGEDKLIGNSEPDTCYPEGTKRNRCIGGAGNDVCITGPRNTDC